MSQIRGLLKGPKFNGRHSTVIPCAVEVIELAKACPDVTKISLGVITPVSNGKRHVKFSETQGGLRMQVRGTNAVQVFYLYSSRPAEVVKEIERRLGW